MLENVMGELANEHPNQHGDAHLVSGNKIKWRREFNSTIDEFWDKSENGITIPNPNAGTMVVAMGTTANAESSLVSKEIFTFPFKCAVSLAMSQRIANQEVFFEIVGCDEQGNLYEERVAAWALRGTTPTQGFYEVRNGPPARLVSGATSIPTTASQSILEMTLESDEVWWTSKLPDSTAARPSNGKRDSVCPDPAGMYKLRVRFKNGSTAPASNTNVTLGFVLAIDNTDFEVEVRGGNGNSTLAQSIPVQIMGGTAAISSIGSTGALGAVSAVNLAANATYTTSAFDVGTNPQYGGHRVAVSHTAGLTPGTLIYEESADGTNYLETCRVPIPSDGMVHTFNFPITKRSSRCRFVNGATAQTGFNIATQAVRVGYDGWGDTAANLPFLLSTTALGVSATFNGPALDLGTNHQWAKIVATAWADQSGALYIQQSRDGANWRTLAYNASVNAMAASSLVIVEQPIVMRYVRAVFANNATAQTSFDLVASLISL